MKTTYAVVVCVLLLLVSACAQKVNDPADVQAIKKSSDDYVKALNAKDADAVAVLMTDKTFYSNLNVPTVVGKEAIQKLHQSTFDQFDFQLSSQIADVQVIGDLGVARGTWTRKLAPKASGLASSSDSGDWTVVFKRQADGSWKWDSAINNSDQPVPGSTANGADEQALYQIEQDWANALVKSDAATLERILAKEWTYNSDGQVQSRALALAEVKTAAYKLESMKLSDMSAHVFGDSAIVTATAVMRGKYKGKDIPGPIRGTDFFVKRDGRWQAVNTQSITIK
jgi:uncharacterized protein (TIGR02246 family)